jgi:hypothetical protein
MLASRTINIYLESQLRTVIKILFSKLTQPPKTHNGPNWSKKPFINLRASPKIITTYRPIPDFGEYFFYYS